MVKCAECGLLALRNKDSRQLIEVENEYRQNGIIVNVGLYELKPLCVANSANIADEIETTRKLDKDEPKTDGMGGTIPPNWAKHIRVVLSSKRRCKYFRKWQLGFTPREHIEMIDRKRERRWHIIEVILIVSIGLIGSIGSAIVGALIATGKIPWF